MFELLQNIFTAIVGVAVSFILIFTGSPTEEITITPTDTQKEETVEIVEEETEDHPKADQPGAGKEEVEEVVAPTPRGVGVPTASVGEKTPDEPTVVEIDPSINILDLITTIPAIETEPQITISEVNENTREALVNILCISKQGGLIQPITGSGVTIDARGVILTNAHIAQYYLLKDYTTTNFLDCTIRIGSPARNMYRAELLFISPAWIKANYQKIILSSPKGTGEDDFALLLITERTNGEPIPLTFPSLSPDTRGVEPEIGDTVLVAGYPAGFLGGITIQKDLHAVSTVTQIMDVFTFGEKTLDLISVGGNIAAQKGSSGGAVVSTLGKLLGIVVTATEATNTDDRDLRAISLFHVNESLKKDMDIDLDSYLFGNLLQKANQFNEVLAPTLTGLLESALDR